jgi:uncharacterized OB-fold protein/acyl dehydratase
MTGHTPTASDGLTDEEYEARLQGFVGLQVGPPYPAPDEVNVPMIRHWCEAMGDTNPVYLDADAAESSLHGGVVAPPTMLQAWVMRGLTATVNDDTGDGPAGPYDELTAMLASRGYTSVVATNCDQTYHRYLRPGDRLEMVTTITGVSPKKTTALGEGHFVTTRQDYLDANGDIVGSMEFRIIRFRPRAADAGPGPGTDTSDAPPRPAPATTPDSTWWFDALAEGRLVVQRCSGCGTLRHPPGPMCPRCHNLSYDHVEATGTGEIHAMTVVHYPKVPGFTYPLGVALVDVHVDGDAVRPVRVVMNTEGCEPHLVRIGDPVRIEVREDRGQYLPFAVLDPDVVAGRTNTDHPGGNP